MDFNNIFQLYSHLGHLGTASNRHAKIAIAHNSIVTEGELNAYSNQLRQVYDHVFVLESDTEENKKALVNLETVLMFQLKQTPMPVCNKILSRNESSFRCYDCQTHESSVLCKACFQEANHKGHRYIQMNSGGGNCDCGNPDAINPIGFCVNHPGKAQPVQIKPEQEKHFTQVIGMLIEWMFRLVETGKFKSADVLGQILSDFLLKRNEKSLYYNTLTYRLIFSKRIFGDSAQKREKKIIEKIFHYGIKLLNFANKMTDVFLNMFSLQVLKYELTLAYTIAYNTIEGFESSKFKSLYIQLFANNELVQKMLCQEQLVLWPSKSKYSEVDYIENLIFLSSIKKQVAEHFFTLVNKKGAIKYKTLDTIQKNVQTNNEHIVNTINQTLDQQNNYYTLMITIVRLIKDNPASLGQMLANYIDAVMDAKYSYHKNKLVMPFHKVLSIILCALFRADVSSVSCEMVEKMTDCKYQAKDVFAKVFKLILGCWKEFAKTFYETSYFDNYIPLYVKMGNTTVIYDMLMFSICLKTLEQCQNVKQLNEILFEVFQIQTLTQSKPQIKEEKLSTVDNPLGSSLQNDAQINQDCWMDEDDSQMDDQNLEIPPSKPSQPTQILKNNTELIKIIIEACISQRAQIIVANSLKINNQTLKTRTQTIFIEAMNNFKQISAQNLQSLCKNFIQSKNIDNEVIKGLLTFDKNRKKYVLNQMKDQKFSTSKLPLFLYPTMKKFGGIFAEEIKQPIENLLMAVDLPQQNIKKLQYFFNDHFIQQISTQFITVLTTSDNHTNKQIVKSFLDFLDVIKTLQYLMRQHAPKSIYEIYEKIAQLSQREQFSFLGDKCTRKQSEDLRQKEKISAKLKFEQKKKKKLEKMKKMQESYAELLQENNDENKQSESTCLICRQDQSKGLCFLSTFSYSNILQSFNNTEGRTLAFDSCFHPIHIKCFNKSSKQQTLPCPLCKSLSNIMLPFQKQFNEKQTIFEIFERINTLKVVLGEQYKGYDGKFEENGILSVFRSLSSMIGKNLLKKQPILDEKDQRIANILYGVVKTVGSCGKKEYELGEEQIQQYFEQTLSKLKERKPSSTNLYAMQYVIVKLLYSCFTQNPNSCIAVLNEPATELVNRNDLKKIWQMCNQIVSLPICELPQQESLVSEMQAVVDIYVPPETVRELIELRDSEQMSCKNGHQMCLCITCKAKCCFDCKQTKKHFKQKHCGEGLAFNLLAGGLVYIWDNKLVLTPSLYSNQMGFEWKPSKSPEGFQLDTETYHEAKMSILDQKIPKFLMKKYPDILKKGIYMDGNLGMF